MMYPIGSIYVAFTININMNQTQVNMPYMLSTNMDCKNSCISQLRLISGAHDNTSYQPFLKQTHCYRIELFRSSYSILSLMFVYTLICDI